MINGRFQVLYIMGVSGSGKSTIGRLLAQATGFPFFDGDDYHPEANVSKMKAGFPLNDADRKDWLETLYTLAQEQTKSTSCIISCSALKEKYRNTLTKDLSARSRFIYLKGTYDSILQRMRAREGHFMPPELLKSQFDTLEEPLDALTLDSNLSPEEMVAEIMKTLFNKTEFGLIGLGVMGKSLCRNLTSKGFVISMYNRHVPDHEVDIAINFKNSYPELKSASAFDHLESFVNSLQQPRKIMLMVNAGKPVDAVMEELLPLLSNNDIIIDGGNSHFKDTERRISRAKEYNVHFIGCGVSGGEEGALTGPSIMPGGASEGYQAVAPFLETIAAKNKEGNPCCAYIGPEGSGHFVKMVHNGIEYVEMQLLAEVYQILRRSNKNPAQIAQILQTWQTKQNSYLLEITLKILNAKSESTWLIDTILDKAGNKGTGNWTAITAAELGYPATMVTSALFARYISSFKEARITFAERLGESAGNPNISSDELLDAYALARLLNHYQGFSLLTEASKANYWNLNTSTLASIWTNGCIIRSDLMEELAEKLIINPDILKNDIFLERIKKQKSSLAQVVSVCIQNAIAVPALSDAIQFLNGISTSFSPANLIQAQRDFFGAHMYQKTDDPSGAFYHTDWNKLNLS